MRSRNTKAAIAAAAERVARKEIPAQYATEEVRLARLLYLRARMKLTFDDFAALLGISLTYIRQMVAQTRPVTMPVLKLAEREYQAFLWQNGREQPKEDPKLGAKIIERYIKGSSEEAIVKEMKTNSETVAYWISLLA